MIFPYKNRDIDYNKTVDFYRCLNRKGYIFSLRQNGLVVGHTDNIILKNCKFIINQTSKERCIRTQSRNVHAFINGFIGNIDDIKNQFSFILNYNPYISKGFYTSLGEINKCKIIYIQNKTILCQI